MKQPHDGYTSGQKRHYRREVWAFIERALRATLDARTPIPDRRVLVLESSRGLEVEELLRRGYRSSLIHVVNDSPAIVASVQRRLADHPRRRGPLQTHGTSLDAAIAHCQSQGLRFDAMNLDFTGCITDQRMATVARAASLMKPFGAFVVTVQRGREPWLDQAGPDNGDPHRVDAIRVARIAYAASAGCTPRDQNGCQWHIGLARWGAYRGHNSRVTMTWVGMQLIPHALSGVGSLWQTDDPFLPRCGVDAVIRKTDSEPRIKMLHQSRRLVMKYQYRDGQGMRFFLEGRVDDATRQREFGTMPATVCPFDRPEILNRWASQRRSEGREQVSAEKTGARH